MMVGGDRTMGGQTILTTGLFEMMVRYSESGANDPKLRCLRELSCASRCFYGNGCGRLRSEATDCCTEALLQLVCSGVQWPQLLQRQAIVGNCSRSV